MQRLPPLLPQDNKIHQNYESHNFGYGFSLLQKHPLLWYTEQVLKGLTKSSEVPYGTHESFHEQ